MTVPGEMHNLEQNENSNNKLNDSNKKIRISLNKW
jgi:hypothetical protein